MPSNVWSNTSLIAEDADTTLKGPSVWIFIHSSVSDSFYNYSNKLKFLKFQESCQFPFRFLHFVWGTSNWLWLCTTRFSWFSEWVCLVRVAWSGPPLVQRTQIPRSAVGGKLTGPGGGGVDRGDGVWQGLAGELLAHHPRTILSSAGAGWDIWQDQ